MTTYYVDGVDGDDANAGTSEGSGNAWATIDKAMNTVAAGGDHVYIKGNGTYSETPNIDTAAILTSWNIFEGYTTTPGDGGKATISGTTNCLTASTAATYYLFKNLIFTGASSHGVSAISADNLRFSHCEFTSNGAVGALGDNRWNFSDCVFANNAQQGAACDVAATFFGCTSYGNGNRGLEGVGIAALINCLVYNNGATSDAVYQMETDSVAVGNTIDGDGTSGACIHCTTELPSAIVNNILYDATTAVHCASTSTSPQPFFDYNLINSCTNSYWTGSAERSREPDNGAHDVTSAPSFTDEANDDYSLKADSPAKGAGLEAP